MTAERERYETMKLATAAAIYDVKLSTLKNMCLRDKVKSKLVGGLRYVTPEEMDKVFK